MLSEEMAAAKRFSELCARAFGRSEWAYSEFLTPFEQEILSRTAAENEYVLSGGYTDAERVTAAFGNEDDFGYAPEEPFVCVKIEPLKQKFADVLTHRDFLGSLMALGIRREMLGDIVITENCGYVFCLKQVAPYIYENLKDVRHTTVKCSEGSLPEEIASPEPTVKTLTVSSERLDAAVAAVYNFSRSESAALIVAGKVSIGGRVITEPSKQLKSESMVSVRGTGRFLWGEIKGTSKKQKLRVEVGIY